MVRRATDADFNGRILKGLLLKRPNLDIIRVQDVGLRTASDPDVLVWTASVGRVLLTHDRETMTKHAHDRVRANLSMPGLFVVQQQRDIGQSIEDILLIDECCSTEEWANQVVFLPW